MPCKHLILCSPLLLLPSILPSIRDPAQSLLGREAVFQVWWAKDGARVPSASRDASRLAPGLKVPDCWVSPSTSGCYPVQLSTHVSHWPSSAGSQWTWPKPPSTTARRRPTWWALWTGASRTRARCRRMSGWASPSWTPTATAPGVSACPFLVAPRHSCPRLLSQQHRAPPSADSVTPRTTGLSILLGTSTGPGDTEKAQLVICTVHWRSLQKTQQREEDARSSVTVVKGAAVWTERSQWAHCLLTARCMREDPGDERDWAAATQTWTVSQMPWAVWLGTNHLPSLSVCFRLCKMGWLSQRCWENWHSTYKSLGAKPAPKEKHRHYVDVLGPELFDRRLQYITPLTLFAFMM